MTQDKGAVGVNRISTKNNDPHPYRPLIIVLTAITVLMLLAVAGCPRSPCSGLVVPYSQLCEMPI